MWMFTLVYFSVVLVLDRYISSHLTQVCIPIHEVEKIPYKNFAIVSQSAAQTCAGDKTKSAQM